MSQLFIMFSAFVILFVSCGKKYEVYASHPADPWESSGIKTFDFEVADRPYSADILVKHDEEYRFQNLYLIFKSESLSGIESDTLSVQLAGNDGLWLGNCNGKTCLKTMRFKKELRPVINGNIRVEVGQFSREKSLLGIKSISIGLNPV